METEGAVATIPENREIAEILSRGQRSFRLILILAMGFLAIMAAIAITMALRNTRAASELDELRLGLNQQAQNLDEVRKQADELRAEAHNLRQESDLSRIAANRRSMEQKADFEDIRRLLDQGLTAPGAPNSARALSAAVAYLQGQRLSFDNARLVGLAAIDATLSAEERSLLAAVLAMRRFEQSGGRLNHDQTTGAAELTPELLGAREALQRASTSLALKNAAVFGIARLDFIYAQQNNFSQAACKAAIQGPERARVPRIAWTNPQLLLDRAECWRNTGETGPSLSAYRSAVTTIVNTSAGADPTPLSGSAADPILEAQAYHGRGTALIAATAGGASNEATAMASAREDLTRAARLRRDGGETEIEVNYSLENIGFTYLREGQYEAALDHAQKVSSVASLPRNLVIRLIAARALDRSDVEKAARRELLYFRRSELGECELRKMLGARAAGLDDILTTDVRIQDGPASCPTSLTNTGGQGSPPPKVEPAKTASP